MSCSRQRRKNSKMKYKPSFLRFLGHSVVLAVSIITLTGCMATGPDYRTRRTIEAREDALLAQETTRKQEGRFETVEIELNRINQELQRIEINQGQMAQADIDQLRQQIAGFESRLNQIERNRETDKQEIISKLSAKMADLIQASTTRSASTSTRSSSSSRSRTTAKSRSGGYGYEHEVQPGENISAIAAVYGVSVSTIVDENGLDNPNQIRVGQKLFIPE